MNEENKKPYDEEKLTEAQGKKIVLFFIVLFTVFMIVVITYLDRQNADEIIRDYQREDAEEMDYEELQTIDELCSTRLKQYTSAENKLALDSFLYSYNCVATETGWVNDEGKLIFNYSTGTMVLSFEKGEKNYRRTVTYDSNAFDNIDAKIGAREFTMSRDDAFAIGRAVMGDVSDWELVE